MTRFTAWLRPIERDPDMSLEWTCCGMPARARARTELGTVNALALTVHSCSHCGMGWMRVFSPAAGTLRWLPARDRTAESLLGRQHAGGSEDPA